MNRTIRGTGFLLLAAVLYCSAQQEHTKYRDALLLEVSEYDPCHHDCAPFDRPTLFMCIQLGHGVLIGSRKADWVWGYDSSKMFAVQGKPVSIRFNRDSIWLVRTDGKELRLTQNYTQDVFHNSACVAEVHRRWLSRLGEVLRPSTVPASATLVPTSMNTYFWVSCIFEPGSHWDLCSVWDSKGVKYKQIESVNSHDNNPVPQTALIIDPLHTTNDYQFVLQDGTLLTDWAKARINNIPVTEPSRTPSQKP
jgi:hypothetical protein